MWLYENSQYICNERQVNRKDRNYNTKNDMSKWQKTKQTKTNK